MKEILWNLGKSLAGSKKFAAMMIGLLMLLGAKIGLDESVSRGLSEQIVALVASFVVGQGIADHGKEAELIKKEA